jgi:membrane protease YdiL (CAAX protease family)
LSRASDVGGLLPRDDTRNWTPGEPKGPALPPFLGTGCSCALADQLNSPHTTRTSVLQECAPTMTEAPAPFQVRGRTAASMAGLTIAWGGTLLLISPIARGLGDPMDLSTAVIGQLLLWLLAAAVVAIVLFWERQTLRSLWLQPFHWRSIAWGLLLAIVHYAVLFPAGEWVRRITELPGFAAGMDDVMRFPLWYRMLAVLGAGVVEETLFRGFTVTRLCALTGRLWLAATLALLGFSALHVPMWGWGFAVGGLVSGTAAMAFFVWRKDLLAMIAFHTLTDATGLIVAPLFSHWWKTPAFF